MESGSAKARAALLGNQGPGQQLTGQWLLRRAARGWPPQAVKGVACEGRWICLRRALTARLRHISHRLNVNCKARAPNGNNRMEATDCPTPGKQWCARRGRPLIAAGIGTWRWITSAAGACCNWRERAVARSARAGADVRPDPAAAPWCP